MKVLLVTPFALTHSGGVNDHIWHLDAQLRRMGHTTRILSPGAINERDDGHTYQLGAAVPIPVNGSVARITLSPFISGKIKAFLHREKFDVIHLHEPLTPTLPLLVLLHSQVTNVGTFHASGTLHDLINLGYSLGKPAFRYLVDKLHSRIAVSPASRTFAENWFPGDFRIIPNGVDYDAFGSGVIPRSAHISDAPTIMFAGRYNESRKGFRYLLEALRIVQMESPRARLLVVGPGEPQPFQRVIQQLDLKNVIFTGEVPRHALPSYYAMGDVFCAPSTGRESFGIVLLEGMASGKPVVATDIDGYRDVVRHGRQGILVRPEDPGALANALLRVLSDPPLAQTLGNAGREHARDFSWPSIARRVLRNYEQARAVWQESMHGPRSWRSLANSAS